MKRPNVNMVQSYIKIAHYNAGEKALLFYFAVYWGLRLNPAQMGLQNTTNFYLLLLQRQDGV